MNKYTNNEGHGVSLRVGWFSIVYPYTCTCSYVHTYVYVLTIFDRNKKKFKLRKTLNKNC